MKNVFKYKKIVVTTTDGDTYSFEIRKDIEMITVTFPGSHLGLRSYFSEVIPDTLKLKRWKPLKFSYIYNYSTKQFISQFAIVSITKLK